VEVQRVSGKQKRGEVHVLSAVVVVELLTDSRVPDFVLSPVVVGASRRALQQMCSAFEPRLEPCVTFRLLGADLLAVLVQ